MEVTNTKIENNSRWLALLMLVLAGEAIFLLPFVLPRVFKPTMLAVFEVSNLELGAYFSAYGIVAVIAYLFGGPLADRFAPHQLMSAALIATAVGGLYMYTIPDTQGMSLLYACWGLTTILLFWAAMLRTTRLIGGLGRQGLAFGTLEGGRGLVSALIASVGVAILSQAFPINGASVSPTLQKEGLQAVILAFSIGVFAVSIPLWWVLRRLAPAHHALKAKGQQSTGLDWQQVKLLLKRRAIWLNAIIILCAYSGYRVLDDVSLLAYDVLGYDEVGGARIGGLSLYIRPIVAIGGGLLADRFLASRMSAVSFSITIVGMLAVLVGAIGSTAAFWIYVGLVCACTGIYALRGLYFALIDEGQTPLLLTGTAIGLASVIGYLPDIYMAPLMGILLDLYPGALGHQLVFGLGAGFALVGLLCVILFRRSLQGPTSEA